MLGNYRLSEPKIIFRLLCLADNECSFTFLVSRPFCGNELFDFISTVFYLGVCVKPYPKTTKTLPCTSGADSEKKSVRRIFF